MAISSIYVVCDTTAVLPELCVGAKALADKVTAIVFASKADAQAAAACGADVLLYCEATAPEDYAAAIAALVGKEATATVLLNNSIRGRCLAGKIGALLDTSVVTNATELAENGGAMSYKRMVYGGTAQRVEVFTKPYGVLTLGSGAFDEPDSPAVAAVCAFDGVPEGGLKRIDLREKSEGGTNLAAAKRIVDVGRGLAAEEDLAMCRKLASVLDAEVGCSRPVAENNKWLPKSSYMGVTGVQVKPDLCLVLGVSGQVQHIAGINKSKVIVAINKDKEAPIFKNADFGIVGDLYKVVPALIEKLS